MASVDPFLVHLDRCEQCENDLCPEGEDLFKSFAEALKEALKNSTLPPPHPVCDGPGLLG